MKFFTEKIERKELTVIAKEIFEQFKLDDKSKALFIALYTKHSVVNS